MKTSQVSPTSPTPTSGGSQPSATVVPSVGNFVNQGCFQDTTTARVLVVGTVEDESSSGMTVQKCVAIAQANGWKYAGVEFGGQCFYGNTLHNAATASQGDCSQPCAGDARELCGNGNRIQVYQDTTWSIPADADVASALQALNDAFTQAQTDIKNYQEAVETLEQLQNQSSKRRRWSIWRRQSPTTVEEARVAVENAAITQRGYVGTLRLTGSTVQRALNLAAADDYTRSSNDPPSSGPIPIELDDFQRTVEGPIEQVESISDDATTDSASLASSSAPLLDLAARDEASGATLYAIGAVSAVGSALSTLFILLAHFRHTSTGNVPTTGGAPPGLPTSTTSTFSSVPTGLCAQTGCSSCTATFVPIPTEGCQDCTTISGVAYPSLKTTVPANVPLPTGPIVLGRDLGNATVDLNKRTLPSPYDFRNYDDFFTVQLWQPNMLHVPHRPGNTGGSSSGLLRGLGQDERVYMSVQGLYGCTSLILISRQAVYMTHMFENPAFTQPLTNAFGQQVNLPTFNQDVVLAIPNGDATPMNPPSNLEPWLHNLYALSAAGGVFNPAQTGGIQAIIVTPGLVDPNNPSPVRYPNEVAWINTYVSTTFGTTAELFIYTTLGPVISTSPYSAAGKVLFMYDPHEANTDTDNVVLGGQRYRCPTQWASWQLWVGYQDFLGGDQYEPFAQDEWAISFADTVSPAPLGGGTVLSRDDIPSVCELMSG